MSGKIGVYQSVGGMHCLLLEVNAYPRLVIVPSSLFIICLHILSGSSIKQIAADSKILCIEKNFYLESWDKIYVVLQSIIVNLP